MKAFLLVLVMAAVAVLLCVLIVPAALSAEAPAGSAGWAATVPATAVVTGEPTAALKAFVPVAKKGLSRKQRKEMGVTFRNIRRVMADMQQAGELEGLSSAEISAEVLNRLIGDNPQAFGDPSVDWDALLEFIEKLIEIIMRLISLWSQLEFDVLDLLSFTPPPFLQPG